MRSGWVRGGWVGGACAFGVAMGCGGRAQDSSDGSPEGGASAQQAGASPIGGHGAGGGSSEPSADSAGTHQGGSASHFGGAFGNGGSSNAAGEAGTAGEPSESDPGCIDLTGVGVDVQVAPDTYPVCRGKFGILPIAYAGGPSTHNFSCCAVSDTSPKYSLMLVATLNSNLSGHFDLRMSPSAPLGTQNLNVTCAVCGRLERPIAIQVFDVPDMHSVTGEIHPSDLMLVQGNRLLGANIQAIPTQGSGPSYDCVPVQTDDAPNDHAVSCAFSGITPGGYKLEASNAGCPAAGFPPYFTVLPAL